MAALRSLVGRAARSHARVRCCAASAPKPATVMLNYQEPPPPGKRMGRYINQPDKGDAVDECVPTPTLMHDGRLLQPPAALHDTGFALERCPTSVRNFRDDDEVVRTYYTEMRELVKRASGATRVMIFDHTVRNTGSTSLNAAAGGTAAAVPRVHCDYTADGAPRRLMQFGDEGVYSHLRKRKLERADVEQLSDQRFAFINVWRNIQDTPVERMPLAVCDTRTVPKSDFFLYELLFPDRTGENYSLRSNKEHQWYYYPRMVKDECLVFKVYDKQEDGPRFVFHTAFDDPLTTPESPARESIEIRAIAFFTEEGACLD